MLDWLVFDTCGTKLELFVSDLHHSAIHRKLSNHKKGRPSQSNARIVM